ncbi:hypothetical protein F5Y13DRAFT_120297 [Hypoxylon sp. FL1857]|nr:hypothetical protein F5Y13DRAFT_120297 [Hypoxylon sp. FL1857]
MSTTPTSPAELAAVLKAFPACGLQCLLGAVQTQSNCSVSDPACACASQAVQATAALCAAQSCTIPDALTTENLANTLCGIKSPHEQSYIIVIYTFVALASILVALRFVARLTKRNPLWWDDYAILVSMLITIGFTAVSGVFDHLGVGLDLWAVPQQNLDTIFILLWVALMCYITSRCFVRVSLSLFLMRIFRVSGARPLIMLTLVLNVLITISFTFVLIFQCTPVSYFWTRWDGLHEGSCVDQWAVFLTGGILSTSLDVFLILLPARWIFQLQFSFAKKVTTAGMFSLGLIVIVTSIMRIVALHTFTHSQNLTRDLPGLVIWGGLELYVAIICACLPSLRPLMKVAFSQFRTWATRGSQATKSSPSGGSDPRIYSDGRKRLPSKDIQYVETGKVVGKPTNIWLTTTVQQQHQDLPLSESRTNLTVTALNDIELYDRQKGNSRGDAWA